MSASKQPCYVDDLLACQGDCHRNFIMGDSISIDTLILCHRGRWLAVKGELGARADVAQEIALVSLEETADPEPLTAAAMATDFEGDPLWLIDVRAFDEHGGDGAALSMLWRSDRT